MEPFSEPRPGKDLAKANTVGTAVVDVVDETTGIEKWSANLSSGGVVLAPDYQVGYGTKVQSIRGQSPSKVLNDQPEQDDLQPRTYHVDMLDKSDVRHASTVALRALWRLGCAARSFCVSVSRPQVWREGCFLPAGISWRRSTLGRTLWRLIEGRQLAALAG